MIIRDYTDPQDRPVGLSGHRAWLSLPHRPHAVPVLILTPITALRRVSGHARRGGGHVYGYGV